MHVSVSVAQGFQRLFGSQEPLPPVDVSTWRTNEQLAYLRTICLSIYATIITGTIFFPTEEILYIELVISVLILTPLLTHGYYLLADKMILLLSGKHILRRVFLGMQY